MAEKRDTRLIVHLLAERIGDTTKWIVDNPPKEYNEGMKKYVEYLREIANLIEGLLE